MLLQRKSGNLSKPDAPDAFGCPPPPKVDAILETLTLSLVVLNERFHFERLFNEKLTIKS